MKKSRYILCLALCVATVPVRSYTYAGNIATSSTVNAVHPSTVEPESAVEDNLEIDEALPVNISVPSDFSIYIDPINLTGKGQIQSKDYVFQNNGDTDVLVTFSEIYYYFPNDIDFKSLSSMAEMDFYSITKDIYLYMEKENKVTKNEYFIDDNYTQNLDIEDSSPVETTMEQDDTSQVIILTDTPQTEVFSFVLSADKEAPDNKALFRLNGMVNEFPEKPWEDDDIQISVVYSCTPILDIIDEEILDEDMAIEESVTDKQVDESEADGRLAIDKILLDGTTGENGSINYNSSNLNKDNTLDKDTSGGLNNLSEKDHSLNIKNNSE